MIRATYYYFERDFKRWTKIKISVVSNLILPAAWLIFVGLGLPIKFTDHYLDFITPGILVLTIFSTSMSGGSLLLHDNIMGFLNKFLTFPSPRECILTGKMLFITIRGVIQATIILLIALIFGASILHPSSYLLIFCVLCLFGFIFSGISTTSALLLGEYDTYSSITAMISMPLFFTSSALMPYASMPPWLRTIATVNPLSFAIDAIRYISVGILPLSQLIGLGIGSMIVFVITRHIFKRYTLSL
jgi:ABC-2 type transport system permease protein